MQAPKPKLPATNKKDDGDGETPPEEEGCPDERRSLLGEFAKRHGYNIPPHRQISEKTFRQLLKQHLSRSLPVMKLSDVVIILDEQKFGESNKQVATVRGKLKVRRSRVKSSFARSPDHAFWRKPITRWFPYNVAYLETLLYGYVVCSLKDNPESPWFALNSILGYFDTFDPLVVRACNCGGAAKGLIPHADLVLRTEIFRLNGCPTAYPFHTCGESIRGWGGNSLNHTHP